MDHLLTNEEINFMKLKLANVNYQFLETVKADGPLLMRFTQIWNCIPLDERSKFLGVSNKSIRNKLSREIEAVKGNMKSCSKINLLSNPIIAGKSPQNESNLLWELKELVLLDHPQLVSLRMIITSMIRLVTQSIVLPSDWCGIFAGEFILSRMGSPLLYGEKYILTSNMYDLFEDEIYSILHTRTKKIDQNRFSLKNLSNYFIIHLLFIEDKILENFFEFNMNQKPIEIISTDDPNNQVEPLKVIVMSKKSKVNSNVALKQNDHRFFKVRSSMKSLDKRIFLTDPDDINIKASFHSLIDNMNNEYFDTPDVKYNNFILNNIGCNSETLKIRLNDFRTKLSDNKIYSNQKRDKNMKQNNNYNNNQTYNNHSHQNNKHNNHYNNQKRSNNQTDHTNRRYNTHTDSSNSKQYKNRNRITSEHELLLDTRYLFEQFEKEAARLLATDNIEGTKKELKLKASSTSYYHPNEYNNIHTNSIKIADDNIDTNLSINLDELDFSKNLSNSNIHCRTDGSNFFTIEPNEDNKSQFHFERFDCSDNNSILNLIENRSKQQIDIEDSKKSGDISYSLKEILPALLCSPKKEIIDGNEFELENTEGNENEDCSLHHSDDHLFPRLQDTIPSINLPTAMEMSKMHESVLKQMKSSESNTLQPPVNNTKKDRKKKNKTHHQYYQSKKISKC